MVLCKLFSSCSISRVCLSEGTTLSASITYVILLKKTFFEVLVSDLRGISTNVRFNFRISVFSPKRMRFFPCVWETSLWFKLRCCSFMLAL